MINERVQGCIADTLTKKVFPEMYPTEVKKDVVLKDGTLKLQGT